MPTSQSGTVFVCGEIIEHLSDPGLFLKKLRKAMMMNRVADARADYHGAECAGFGFTKTCEDRDSQRKF